MGVPVTYAATYRTAYRHRMRDLNRWVHKRVVGERSLRARLWRSKHVLVMASTQTLGAQLSAQTLRETALAYRTASLEARLRLRALQRRLIEHLWRPEGALATRTLTLAAAQTSACLHGLYERASSPYASANRDQCASISTAKKILPSK